MFLSTSRPEHADLEAAGLGWLILPLAAAFVFGSTVMSLAALA